MNLLSQVELKNEVANSFLCQLEEDLAQALENLNRAQEKQKKYVDKKRRDNTRAPAAAPQGPTWWAQTK